VYKSYRGVETLIGKDPSTLLTIPRADDPVGQRAVFAKLGMPEAADKYEITAPDGADDAYKAWVKDTFHKAGLTATQAKALSSANTEYVKAQMAEGAKTYERSVAVDKAALLSEWRGGYERQMNAAQTAVKALGFNADMIDALEQTQGYAATMKFFAALGQKLGEDSFVSGTGKGSGFGATQTPAEAAAEWNAMKIDPVQSKALFDPSHPGHEAAKLKQKQLFAIMHPEG
jgi:flavodoxin